MVFVAARSHAHWGRSKADHADPHIQNPALVPRKIGRQNGHVIGGDYLDADLTVHATPVDARNDHIRSSNFAEVPGMDPRNPQVELGKLVGDALLATGSRTCHESEEAQEHASHGLVPLLKMLYAVVGS